MIELLRSGVLTGLGAALVTGDKVEEVFRKLEEQGKISAEEAAALRDELLNSGEAEWSRIRERGQEFIRKGMDEMDLPSKARVQALEERLADMEKKLTAMELKLNMERQEP